MREGLVKLWREPLPEHRGRGGHAVRGLEGLVKHVARRGYILFIFCYSGVVDLVLVLCAALES